MMETSSCVSTDIRDKIYALLGLAKGGLELVSTPNYIRSPQNVYCQTFKAALLRIPGFSYITTVEDNTIVVKEGAD
jgi:hypothetical protein